MNATPSNTPQDLVELQNQLGKENANAVAKFVDGRITAALENNKAELKELGDRVRKLHADHGATDEVKEAAQVVSEATKGNQGQIDAIVDRTQYPDESVVVKDTEQVEEARKVVEKAEKSLEERMTAAEGDIDQLKKDVESLKGGQSGIKAQLEGLSTAVNSAGQTAARAFAMARAGDGSRLERIARLTLTVGGVVAIAYALIWGLSPLNHKWVEQVVAPLAAAGAVGWMLLLWLPSKDTSSASAQASASSKGGPLKKRDKKSSEEGGHQEDAEDVGTTIFDAQASSEANANGDGHAQAGSSASAH